MGFRDFQLFNQAMLAKEGWRLFTKPDSLCAHVLRGKYYHNSDFMDAKKKRNTSHIWNTILHGREAIEVGLIKRPGDGTSIRVWTDPWIPENSCFKPIVQKPGADVLRVNELINDEGSGWNGEKLDTNFVPADVAAISKIPLSRFGEDFWSWSLE
jgi:hypothetical protein